MISVNETFEDLRNRKGLLDRHMQHSFNVSELTGSTLWTNEQAKAIRDLLIPERKLTERPARLYFTIGVQRSGKSTYCTRWAQNLEMPGDGYPRAIVCADSIRIALHGQRYKYEAEPMVFAMDTYMIRSLLVRGHDVIADETGTTERSIRRILEIDPDAQHILIDTPKEVCIARAFTTNQSDLVPVIERCHAQLVRLKAYGVDRVVEEVRKAVKAGCKDKVLPF
jgi:hypothetical protein